MPTTAKPYHHGHLKQELINAALKAIENRGQVDFNLREIAQTCGVSVAALYRHFASKNQLLIELARIGFETLRQTYREIMQQPDTASHLKQLGTAYVLFAMNNEGLFRVMFCRELCQLPEFEQIEATASETLTMLQQTLSAQPSSCSGPLPPAVLAAWARVHGLAFLWLDRNLSLTREQFIENVGQILTS